MIFLRPPPDHHEPFRGPNPNSWPSPQNMGPPSHVGNHSFANQFPPRPAGNMAVSSNPVRALKVIPILLPCKLTIFSSKGVFVPFFLAYSKIFLMLSICPHQGPVGAIPGSMDGSFPGPTVSSAPMSHFVRMNIKLYRRRI